MAAHTLTLPHPYTLADAQWWIGTHAKALADGTQLILATTLREAQGPDAAGTIIGSVGLAIKPQFDHAEMGYSVGVDYWNRGYTTEAAAAMLRHGFVDLKLNRIFAHHYDTNPSSGRVMQKLGMSYEGTLRKHIKKWGEFHDAVCYGMVASDWHASQEA